MYFIYFYLVSYCYSCCAALSINETDDADKLIDKQYETAITHRNIILRI